MKCNTVNNVFNTLNRLEITRNFFIEPITIDYDLVLSLLQNCSEQMHVMSCRLVTKI